MNEDNIKKKIDTFTKIMYTEILDDENGLKRCPTEEEVCEWYLLLDTILLCDDTSIQSYAVEDFSTCLYTITSIMRNMVTK